MIEAVIDARRGDFRLDLACRLAASWTIVFGPSGAGKSTLLRLLAGLDRNTVRGGTIRVVHEKNVLSDSSDGIWIRHSKRQTAMVTQHPALFPHLSVRSNVAYGIAHLPRDKRDQRVQRMLELAGGLDLMDRHPRGLSGGEAQRVALARALATGPRLLLLDEPFSALDGSAADALLNRLHEWVKAEGVQTIQATHDATDAFITGAEVILLQEGRLAAKGPAETVLAPERARLLGWLKAKGT